MKKALLFLSLFVAGCVSPGQVCTNYGFAPGTSEFAQCLQAEMQNRAAMRAQSIRLLTPQPVPAPRTIHCRTVYVGNVARTICN